MFVQISVPFDTELLSLELVQSNSLVSSYYCLKNFSWLILFLRATILMALVKILKKLRQKLRRQQPRQQLTYEQMLAILKQEAHLAALNRPQHFTILAGDSLSSWFPTDLLPPERTWLNQGIAGDTSAGLLQRLELFDKTQPERIFVMIGINDLIRGVADGMILENQRQIVRYLRRVHPESQIVLQSILPHNQQFSNWKRADPVANSQIRQLNQEIEAIAAAEGAKYLDLHSLFTDTEGNLRPELTTDGLHLGRQGYLVWRSALQMYK